MSDEKPRALRPDDVEPDPRTDGVGDGGQYDLPPLDSQSIAEAVDQDARRALEYDGQDHESE